MTKINYRNNFLGLICIGFCLATAYSIIEPTVGNRQVSSFNFPDRIPLKSWQLLDTESVAESKAEKKDREEIVASAKNYTYSKDNLALKVEMFYLVGTRGNVPSILEKQIAIPAEVLEKAKTKRAADIGFYTIFHHRDRAYLSSCINSRGDTTVNHKQFSQNRYKHDLKYDYLLPWILGKESIRDRRCLLANLSLPLDNLSPEIAYEILEEVWQDWYSWWQPQFPTL